MVLAAFVGCVDGLGGRDRVAVCLWDGDSWSHRFGRSCRINGDRRNRVCIEEEISTQQELERRVRIGTEMIGVCFAGTVRSLPA